jgi:hypothetical protein
VAQFYRDTEPEFKEFAVFGSTTRSPSPDPEREILETYPEASLKSGGMDSALPPLKAPWGTATGRV